MEIAEKSEVGSIKNEGFIIILLGCGSEREKTLHYSVAVHEVTAMAAAEPLKIYKRIIGIILPRERINLASEMWCSFETLRFFGR